ncbi:MAG: glycosyltransferase family 4 protein, partial [Verrucomicrobiota bacterium]|nr:glycosyltransferase family 4 protein [Verrucomicrobiota bacterium]
SRATARDLELFFGAPPPPVTIIPNGLDHARFTPERRVEARAWAAQRHGLKKPFFLYVARIEHPAKNHARLIAAFNRFKNETKSRWQLVFGGADWHGAEMIHALIRQSPHAADIHCLGFVDDAELPQWYRAAGAFVYPSLFEGFGLPPLEAMACGCPVATSPRGALGEIVGGAALTLDPENIGQMAGQLTRLSADENLREQLRADGLVHARCFDWQATAAATLDIYARAAARKKCAESLLHPRLSPDIS